MTAAANLDQLLESIPLGLKEYFGFSHSIILLAGDKQNTLITIAHRGYPPRRGRLRDPVRRRDHRGGRRGAATDPDLRTDPRHVVRCARGAAPLNGLASQEEVRLPD